MVAAAKLARVEEQQITNKSQTAVRSLVLVICLNFAT